MSVIPRRELIVFAGDKGVGKTTLIKALFPKVEVDYSEPSFFRDYEVGGGVYAREVRGDPSVIEVLTHSVKAWRIRTALLVFDLSNRSSVFNLGRWHSLIPTGVKTVLVGNKADLAERNISDEEVDTISRRIGARYFIVSAKTGKGVDELARELAIPVEKEAVRKVVGKEVGKKAQPPAPRVIRKDYLPIPHDFKPSLDGLSDIEIKILELVDGSRKASEIAEILNLDAHSLLIFLKRLHAKGKIKDLQVLIG